MTLHRLTHIGICVCELPRALGFYRDALGFVEVGRFHAADAATATILELPGADLELVYLERDGVRIELLHYRAPAHTGRAERRAMNAPGLTHLSFTVRDLDATTRAIERHGGSVLASTATRFAQGSRGVFALDPDGTRIELIERAAQRAPSAS